MESLNSIPTWIFHHQDSVFTILAFSKLKANFSTFPLLNPRAIHSIIQLFFIFSLSISQEEKYEGKRMNVVNYWKYLFPSFSVFFLIFSILFKEKFQQQSLEKKLWRVKNCMKINCFKLNNKNTLVRKRNKIFHELIKYTLLLIKDG